VASEEQRIHRVNYVNAQSNAYTKDGTNKLKQNCQNNFNISLGGKAINFLSPFSMIPGIGPVWQSSMAEKFGGSAAKYVAFEFFRGAGAKWAGTGIG
jgi:hypothetical protein